MAIGRRTLLDLAGRGLGVTTRCDRPCRRSLALTVDARTAHRLGLGRRSAMLGRAEMRALRAGTARLRVKASRRVRSRLRRQRAVAATITGVFVDGTGHVTRVKRSIGLRR
jgi:hypothetical protein